MSLSNQNEKSPNPATKFIEWRGGKGVFTYYDKEKGENVEMPKEFQIIPLDQLSTIKGWHDQSESGIYSNEIKYLNEEVLTVKAFKQSDPIAKGLYSEIKGDLEGGKYVKSVYAVMVNKDGVGELINLQLGGSALGPWIDAKVNEKDGVVVTVSTNPEQQKKGATKYYVPVFEVKPLPDGTHKDEATAIDAGVLQPYLNQYRQEKKQEEVTPQSTQTKPEPELVVSDEEEDDLPF